MRHLRNVLLMVLAAAPSGAAGLYAAGNVDGVLTWELGDIPPGQSTAAVVLLVWDASYEDLVARLNEARREAAAAGDGGQPGEPAAKVWIENDTTDFALEGSGYFRWRIERQALRCDRGGQLSQFTYYIHYADEAGEHRAGTPHIDDSIPENLVVLEPVHPVTPAAAECLLKTADERLQVRVRAAMLSGPCVMIRLALTNAGPVPLSRVRLTAYANMEAAHDHENDLTLVDADTGGLVVTDPPTGYCTLMAGLRQPVTGYAGTWNSIGQLQAAQGLPFAEWVSFAHPPEDVARQLERARKLALVPPGIYLPFVWDNPETPETRTLAPEEALSVLERDWLFQAEGQPLLERARQEVGWALAIVARRAASGAGAPHDGGPTGMALHERVLVELGRLDRELQQAARGSADDARAQELYFAVRRCKRDLMFSNPVLDFDEVLFIDQPLPQGPVNPEHEAIHRMGITAVPGGRLLVLKGLHPGGGVRQLAPDRPGSYWRPDLSFDGRRVLFCYKAHDEKSFHLYEVALDGTGLRQLTFGDYDDVDPLYLPNGHILFTTTRGNSYVRCGPFIYSYTLARCDADGGNVYLISQNGEPDFVPALLNDGRVIYSRWEYTDRPLWRLQSLWTTHPDGTNTQAFWGNRSVWPDHLSEPRPIPGSHRIMFSGVGHHDWWSGSIGIIDPARGSNYPAGLTKVTADRPWPECSPPPEDPIEAPGYHSAGPFTGYKTPYPLSEEDFIVSARGLEGKFRLYLMDMYGNRELIYEGAHNIWHAIPLRPRPAPPALPSTVIWPGTGKDRKPVAPGVLFSPDVYEGVPELPRGSVRYLRVFQQDHKTYSTWRKSYRNSGPAVSIVQEEAVKRILSEVPVEPDGSVHFELPAGRSVFFQLLDENYRCLQTMRSFAGVMPGERRGCVGCHELHSKAPVTRAGAALHRVPTPPSPPPWGTESISYERFAQPVLDRHCGACHQGEGKSRQTLDLTLRPGMDVFKEPYLTLVGGAGWGNPVAADQPGYGIAGALPVESIDPTMNDPQGYGPIAPLTSLSYTSKLVEIASSGTHHDVRVDPLSLRRLMAWVDACCPFMGEEELRAQGDPDFPGIEELPIRPRVATAPVVERP